MPLEPESDLHWNAFLYVSGELSPEETSSFENLLADDQGARDAVIQAVELAEALAIAGAGQVRSPRRRSGYRVLAGALTLAAAACVTLVIFPRFHPAPPTEPDASQVAQAWSGLRGGADPDWVASIGDSHATEISDPAQAPDAEPSTERALPSWLLSATSAPRNEAPQEEN